METTVDDRKMGFNEMRFTEILKKYRKRKSFLVYSCLSGFFRNEGEGGDRE